METNRTVRTWLTLLLGLWQIAGSCARPLQAAEYWSFGHLQLADIEYFADLAAFKDRFYIVVGRYDPTYSSKLHTSSNAVDWNPAEAPSNFLYALVVHNGSLYGLDFNGNETALYRTDDGLRWAHVGPGLALIDLACPPVSNGDFLYVGLEEGGVARTRGQGAGWEILPPLPVRGIRLATLGGTLYAVGHIPDADHISRIYHLEGTVWQPSSDELVEEAVFSNERNFIATSRALYWGGGNGLWTFNNDSRQWVVVSTPPSGIIFSFFDNLNVYTSGGMFTLNAREEWVLVAPGDAGCGVGYYISRPAILKNQAYSASLCRIYGYERGLVSLQAKPVLSSVLEAGMKDSVLLEFGLKINKDDELLHLVFDNERGRAVASDFKELSLVETFQGPDGNQFTRKLTSLIPDPDQKTWRTPPDWKRSFLDGQTLIVSAQIADKPLNGATCRFSLKSVRCAYNDRFSLSAPIVASQEQTIVANPADSALEPINGVLVSPIPAKDKVTFLYDLAAASEIRIRIFDRTGDLVSDIKESKPAGNRTATEWNASSMAVGVYHAVVEIESEGQGKRTYRKKVFLGR